MNYLNELLKDEVVSKNPINSNIKLLHPVLYVLFSSEENNKKAFNIIESFNKSKIRNLDKIGYLYFSDSESEINFNKNSLKNGKLKELLNKYQNTFLKNTFLKPLERRIYFIMDAHEDYDNYIFETVKFFDEFFNEVGTTPIIDIFVVTDELNINNEKHRLNISNTYKKLYELRTSVNMIYILSNINDKTTLTDITYHYEAIAQCLLIKDCTFFSNIAKPSYNERNFISNCKTNSKDGWFYKIGTKKIAKPYNIIKAIALKELLSDENKVSNINDKDFIFFENIILKELPASFDAYTEKYRNNIFSMAININNQDKMFFNRQDALDAFFGTNKTYGNNLDMYYNLNIKKDILDFEKTNIINILMSKIKQVLENKEIGFYNTRLILKNLKQNMFKEIRQNLESKESENIYLVDSWLNSPYSGSNKKTFGIMCKIQTSPFELAKDYIDIKSQVIKSRLLIEIFDECNKILEKCINDMDIIFNEIHSLITELNVYINNHIYDMPPIVSENINIYYKEKTNEYIDKNNEFFENVYTYFYKDNNIDIKLILDKCNIYLEKMLHEEEFSDNIFTEISKRLTKDSDSRSDRTKKMLLSEIKMDKVYFSNSLFKENLYEITCFITGDTRLLEEFEDIIDTFDIFFDSTDMGLNILYFSGALSLSSLTYAKNYGFL